MKFAKKIAVEGGVTTEKHPYLYCSISYTVQITLLNLNDIFRFSHFLTPEKWKKKNLVTR
jgi:hypothetical protein